jgi:hypothetical protein
MLNLAATDILAGVAGTATAITYTLTGMELNAGVEAYKVLAQGQLPNSVGTLYTAPSSTQTFIKSLTLANATGSDVSGIKIFLTGTTAGKQITGSLTIPANGWATYEEDGWRVYDATGHVLENISNVSTGGGSAGTGGHDVLTSYEFNSTTTDADPGAGKFRFSTTMTAFVNSVTMYISTVDRNGVDMTAWFDGYTPSLFTNAMLSFYGGTVGTSTGRFAARIDAVTTATGYRKLTLTCLSRIASNPLLTSGDILPITWSAASRGLDLPAPSAGAVFNSSPGYCVPGFIPLRSKAKTLTASRLYVVPFMIRQPIKPIGIRFIITTAATAGNSRGYITKAHHVYSDGLFQCGPVVRDSGSAAANLNSTGAKNLSFSSQTLLPPGYYYACLAIGSLTGSLAVRALNGVFMERPIVNFGSSDWTCTTELYQGNDYTNSDPDPTTAINVTTATLSNSGFSDQFDAPFGLEWESYI